MGWFDEQIRQRMESDQEILESSFLRMAGVVLNRWDENRLRDEILISRRATDLILRYYHQKPVEIPEAVTDPAERLQYALRPSGLMIRNVELTDEWYRDGYGPMLGYLRDSGAMVALLPGFFGGYWYEDPATGKKTRVGKKRAKSFARDAICFYRPLPMKKLGISDLLVYMKNSISYGDLALIVLVALVLTLVGRIEPIVDRLITGSILKNKQVNMLIGAGIFLVSASFTSQMLNMVKSLLMGRINTKTSQAVEASVMMRILSLPVSFFRNFASGELASRAGSVNSLCSIMLNNIFSTGLMSLMSLLYIPQIFQFARPLLVPSLIAILATMILSVATALLQVGISRRRMDLEAKESGMGFAMLGGIQKIRLSGSEKRAFARWADLYAESARLQYNPPTFIKLTSVFATAIGLISTIVYYYIAVEAGIAPNDYYAFSAAYARVMGAFMAMAGIATSIASIPPVLEMAEPILEAEPEVSEEKETVDKVSGNIEMSHISFRYEENTPYVLSDLSLKIRAGEYVAIVGRTGCGKSTLVRLLLGFEKPEKGAVYYDQRDLERLDPRSLRRHIGVVTQNGQLFQGDIFSNITISAPQLTLEKAWEAAEIAGIAQDIRDMPMGMQTIISEGQGGISGGQKQRLMIARAIAPKPHILIFDEATSALDNRTQKQVSDALDGLRSTRIVIAHRLSTIRNCDRILVMDKGAIVEEGTYEELIAKNGTFAELVARQRLDRAG